MCMALKEIMHDEIQEDIDAAVSAAVSEEQKKAQNEIKKVQNDAEKKAQDEIKKVQNDAEKKAVKSFWDLVSDHILTEDQAASRIGMSVQDFTAAAQAILAEEAVSYTAS